MDLRKWFSILTVVFIIGLALFNSADAAPPPIYVDDTAVGLDNGNSWNDAYKDLQEALKRANVNDEIWVAEGTYLPGTDRGDSFELVQGAEMYGGFPDGGSIFSARDWKLYETELSCEIGLSSTSLDNCYHVIDSSDGDETTILDGFIITGGYADGTGYDGHGGGIFNLNAVDGNGVFINLKIIDNYAIQGGGMKNTYSAPTLINVEIETNNADIGGGINNDQGRISILSSTIIGNHAEGNGGGMYNDAGHPTFKDTSIIGNGADYGGGLYNEDATTLEIIDSTIWANAALYSGGGIFSYADFPAPITTTLSNVKFLRNHAYNDKGGGLYLEGIDASVFNVEFFGNTAEYGGGGYFTATNSLLVNTVFSGNTADMNGGGLFVDQKSSNLFQLLDSTMSTNLASSGGGIYLNTTVGMFYVLNTVLWNNADDQIYANTGRISDSIIQGGCPSVGMICDELILIDPEFVRTPDEGGDWIWGTSDDDYGDLRLSLDSPGIDAGDNNHVPEDILDFDDDGNITEKIPFDIEGFPRMIDVPQVVDTGDGAPPVVDIGAYETLIQLYLPIIFNID
jgi:hypothetical protein